MWLVALFRGVAAIVCFVAAWVAFKLPGMGDDPRPAAQPLPA